MVKIWSSSRSENGLQKLAGTLAQTHGVQAQVVATDLPTEDGRARVPHATSDLDVATYIGAAVSGDAGPFPAEILANIGG